MRSRQLPTTETRREVCMSETSSRRPILWLVVVAALVAAAVWATVAMAAGGSGSSGTGSPAPSFGGPRSTVAADDGPADRDCPHMGGRGGGSGGDSTTPSTPDTTPAPSAPSTQDGSSSPSF